MQPSPGKRRYTTPYFIMVIISLFTFKIQLVLSEMKVKEIDEKAAFLQQLSEIR